MAISRVAVIFDSHSRPETTGVYCLRALKSLVHVEHFQPDRLEQIPRHGFDLYLAIDDGCGHCMPRDLHPVAWWLIDTHVDFPTRLAQARDADYVFAAQRDGAERLRAEGVGSAVWLPLACDPDIHRPHAVAKEYDLCFVGNLIGEDRVALVGRLQRTFPRTFVGQCYFDEMARTYSASRMVFNRSVKNDVNMRVFEALACGSLLVTNDLADNGQAELFRDGVELATYKDADELIDKVRFYLTRDELRERIAAAGRAAVVARHTYRHRLEAILRFVDKGRDVTVSAPEASRVGNRPRKPATPAVTSPAREPRPASLSSPDPGYFEFDRPEVLALIPSAARRVLDIGCAAGRLGASLKQRQPAEVTGVEPSAAAAARARACLDRVIVGDVEALETDFAAGSFDCVVCADVLEHLWTPLRVLRRIRSWLAPAGALVASIPNVRHHTVVRGLLDGNWTYEPAGLLDETHLGFFTRRSIEDLFELAGFRITELKAVLGPGDGDWEKQNAPGEVRIGKLHIGALPPGEAQEFFIYQYLVTATPEQPTLSEPPRAPPQSRRAATAAKRRNAAPSKSRRTRGPMHFTEDYLGDFEQFDFQGEPFAFVRYGDGERAICRGKPIDTQDGWSYAGGRTAFARDLLDALRFDAPDYYVGISDGCCDLEARDWYLRQVRVPLSQLTYANVFVNWNYRRFQKLDLDGCAIVSSGQGDFVVPEDLFRTHFDLDGLVERLLKVDRPILVSAGPASGIIIHRYWQRARRKLTIVDVGSAIDERTKGRTTRAYQTPGTRTAELVCRW